MRLRASPISPRLRARTASLIVQNQRVRASPMRQRLLGLRASLIRVNRQARASRSSHARQRRASLRANLPNRRGMQRIRPSGLCRQSAQKADLRASVARCVFAQRENCRAGGSGCFCFRGCDDLRPDGSAHARGPVPSVSDVRGNGRGRQACIHPHRPRNRRLPRTVVRCDPRPGGGRRRR